MKHVSQIVQNSELYNGEERDIRKYNKIFVVEVPERADHFVKEIYYKLYSLLIMKAKYNDNGT